MNKPTQFGAQQDIEFSALELALGEKAVLKHRYLQHDAAWGISINCITRAIPTGFSYIFVFENNPSHAVPHQKFGSGEEIAAHVFGMVIDHNAKLFQRLMRRTDLYDTREMYHYNRIQEVEILRGCIDDYKLAIAPTEWEKIALHLLDPNRVA